MDSGRVALKKTTREPRLIRWRGSMPSCAFNLKELRSRVATACPTLDFTRLSPRPLETAVVGAWIDGDFWAANRVLRRLTKARKCLWKLVVWLSQPSSVSKWHRGCYEFWKARLTQSGAEAIPIRGDLNERTSRSAWPTRAANRRVAIARL